MMRLNKATKIEIPILSKRRGVIYWSLSIPYFQGVGSRVLIKLGAHLYALLEDRLYKELIEWRNLK